MSHRKKISISGTLLIAMLTLMSIFTVTNQLEAAGTPATTSITNQASSTYEDTNSNSFSANSDTTTVTVQAVYSVTISTPSDQSGQANAGNPVVFYAYTVTNTSNASATFDLTDTEGSWTGTLYADDGAGGGTANDGIHHVDETTVTASTGSLAADATYKFFTAISIPADTADNVTDNTTTNVDGTGAASAATTSDQVTTTADAPTLTIDKDVKNVTDAGAFGDAANADPTDTLEYRMAVSSSGALTAKAVVLTDALNTNTTYVSNSMWIGSHATDYNGAGNVQQDDDNTGPDTCAINVCGQGSVSGTTATVYIGNTAVENGGSSAGGDLPTGNTVYIYFRVTVD